MMSVLEKTALNLRYQLGDPMSHQYKVRENKKAPRPAYDLLMKPRGGKRGRVVFTVLLDLCKD
jgi:CRISPR/Cas system CMR-associated protein Cmr1 (group 7 of RAMP superfamily)